ncbi:unnamed protein product [Lupinus luteus]|uniref:Uncharacterized protein n=1 Tax=Lupinus luteus TaxID=3873 RepID=A0AAV1Y8E3_LUPLU
METRNYQHRKQKGLELHRGVIELGQNPKLKADEKRGLVKARPRPVLTPYPIEKFPSMEANPTVRVLVLNSIKMEGPFLSCTSTYPLFKELAEHPISLIYSGIASDETNGKGASTHSTQWTGTKLSRENYGAVTDPHDPRLLPIELPNQRHGVPVWPLPELRFPLYGLESATSADLYEILEPTTHSTTTCFTPSCKQIPRKVKYPSLEPARSEAHTQIEARPDTRRFSATNYLS